MVTGYSRYRLTPSTRERFTAGGLHVEPPSGGVLRSVTPRPRRFDTLVLSHGAKSGGQQPPPGPDVCERPWDRPREEAAGGAINAETTSAPAVSVTTAALRMRSLGEE